MSFKKTNNINTVFGVIVGNRDVFPDHLAKEGRSEIIETLEELKFDSIILNESDSKFGVVETYNDAKKCAELFKANMDKIIGVLVILPNFGDEKIQLIFKIQQNPYNKTSITNFSRNLKLCL